MSKMQNNNHTLFINSKEGHLNLIEKLLDNVFSQKEIACSKLMRLKLCISEGVCNGIVHGNKNSRDKKVIVVLKIKDNIVDVKIEDEGFGFDYKTIADPTKIENRKKEKGRGIFIIKTYSKKIYYSKNGNTLNFKFDISEV